MEDFPADLMIDILSRLPMKTIIHCKCVCKKWRNSVLESYFVNFHLFRSSTSLIIHRDYFNYSSDRNASNDPGILKWVEIEDKVDHHHLHHDPLMTLHLNLTPILQNSKINQLGSVNGLICIRQYSPKLDNIYICNPIIREIMILPSHHPYYTKGYGFGVSSLTGEYKVVRIFQQNMPSNGYQSSQPSVLEAEVYTLGTGQWRSLGRFPYGLNEFHGYHAEFLNDHCHWIVSDTEKLCSFDLDKETFQLFPSPPSEGIQESRFHHQSLAVLKGCLCKLDTYDSRFTIWVMKEYGIKKSWHKEVVITQVIRRDMQWPLTEPMFLVEGLKDGSILTVCGNKLGTIYPRSKTIEVIKTFKCSISGLAYSPSFLKLQSFELERVRMF